MNGSGLLDRLDNENEGLLEAFLGTLSELDADFCVIGELAINTVARPVYTPNLEVVIEAAKQDRVLRRLKKRFAVQDRPRTVVITQPGTGFCILVRKDPRYQDFISRVEAKTILGYLMPVASSQDLLQEKLWDYQRHAQRPEARRKDLEDIERLADAQPELGTNLPQDVEAELALSH